MRILYIRGLWGMPLSSLEANLRLIREGGFDGVEMGAPTTAGEARALRALLDELGLALIVQQWTQGATPEEHTRSLEEQVTRAAALRPLLINSHTGRDLFSLAENLSVLRRAQALSRDCGVPIVHEIHRGRATYCVGATLALLEAMPELRLTADFSHWCCVHESLLEDQAAAVARAGEHCDHIHARVGHAEGPQVSDPRAPEWREALEAHLRWWQAIVDLHRARGSTQLTICPEFGPPGYMPTLPYTRQPVADLWEINLYMRTLLAERLRV